MGGTGETWGGGELGDRGDGEGGGWGGLERWMKWVSRDGDIRVKEMGNCGDTWDGKIAETCVMWLEMGVGRLRELKETHCMEDGRDEGNEKEIYS